MDKEPQPGEVEWDPNAGIFIATTPPDGHRVIDITLADYVGGSIHIAGPDDAALEAFVADVSNVLHSTWEKAPGLWARDPMFGHRTWIPRGALARAIMINVGYMKVIHPSARRSSVARTDLTAQELEQLRGRR
jgi:hypothetical protein